MSLSQNHTRDEHFQNYEYICNNGRSFLGASATSHFGWTYDGGKTVFDCRGEIRQGRYPYRLPIPQELTLDFCTEALNNSPWNPMFDRHFWLPQIEKFFDLDLCFIDR